MVRVLLYLFSIILVCPYPCILSIFYTQLIKLILYNLLHYCASAIHPTPQGVGFPHKYCNYNIKRDLENIYRKGSVLDGFFNLGRWNSISRGFDFCKKKTTNLGNYYTSNEEPIRLFFYHQTSYNLKSPILYVNLIIDNIS